MKPRRPSENGFRSLRYLPKIAILGQAPSTPYNLNLLIEVIPEVVIGDPDSDELPGCPITALGHDG